MVNIHIPKRLIKNGGPDKLYWYILLRVYSVKNSKYNQTPIVTPEVLASIFRPNGGRRAAEQAKEQLAALVAGRGWTNHRKQESRALIWVLLLYWGTIIILIRSLYLK